jgi:hypothetical protein
LLRPFDGNHRKVSAYNLSVWPNKLATEQRDIAHTAADQLSLSG